jgi:hypothetical protein
MVAVMTPQAAEAVARKCFAALVVAHSELRHPAIQTALAQVIRECTKAGYLPRPGEPVEFREDL